MAGVAVMRQIVGRPHQIPRRRPSSAGIVATPRHEQKNMAPPKKPRRTAERILEVTLDLFNRFGEPNVSTTLISAELNISPGNLYYHYPAKDELINALFQRCDVELADLLLAADNVRNVEDAWFFFHTLFELIWQYRFLYRDLNDLLSKNRRLETHFQTVLQHKTASVRTLLDGMQRAGSLQI